MKPHEVNLTTRRSMSPIVYVAGAMFGCLLVSVLVAAFGEMNPDAKQALLLVGGLILLIAVGVTTIGLSAK